MATKPRIIIEVSGGLVTNIHSDVPIDVDIIDHDCIGDGFTCGDEEIDKRDREIKGEILDETQTLRYHY